MRACGVISIGRINKKNRHREHRPIYIDDRLAMLRMTGCQTEKARKEIQKIFKDNNLAITIETNLNSTDFFGRQLPLTK